MFVFSYFHMYAGIVAVFRARIVVPVSGIISFLIDMIVLVLGITIFSKPLIKKNEGISFFNYGSSV